MNFIFRKFKRMIFYFRRSVLLKYFILRIVSGYKILETSKEKIKIKTRFDKIIYELPTIHDEYLFVADPINELLVSTYMNMSKGTFIDVGAFIGRHTIRLAKNDFVRVIALEPNPISYLLLKRNLELNDMHNRVEILEAALVADDRISEINFESNHGRSRVVSFKDELKNSKQLVKTISFSKLISQYKVDFNEEVIMKIDIEGYEHELLLGMREFLKDFPNKFKIVCEILHNSQHKNETINYLKELNLNVLQVDSENYYIYKK